MSKSNLYPVGDYEPRKFRPLTASGILLMLLSLPFGVGWGMIAAVGLGHDFFEMFSTVGAVANLILATFCWRRRYDLPLVLICYIGPFVGGILAPNFIHSHHGSATSACKSNIKNTGTALEMYSTDNAGQYPTSLAALTPNYLKFIPQCPSAGKDTYSGSYVCGTIPDAYTMFCQGENHRNALLPTNYPQYNSNTGLVDAVK